MNTKNIFAIIITYNPDLKTLGELVERLRPQVGHVLIVDNGSDIDIQTWQCGAQDLQYVEILKLGQNLGIAVGHNKGIQAAKRTNARYVLLMDQDSVPEHNMVKELLSKLVSLPNVAAVGARYLLDRPTQVSPFVRTRGLSRDRLLCGAGTDAVQVDFLISSGCLISIATLDIVGEMREDLFIDYVDVEWGLRANHCGLNSYGVCSAAMRHSLGDAPQTVFGKSIGTHSPLRHYYYVRNALLLYRESWIPFNWKVADGWRLCLRAIVYMLFSKPHRANFRMIPLAILHGLSGRSGKMSDD
ncbi:glycosyltransferase family 2 protein [Actimicrobium sp. CCI2.3]|uniref:glycosyltransferase family 2 protein n=1 Tax=Actimicrobium sp. CCI2.3 TaxID=3048616 RepID=UPI002AB4E5BD|nr:glycosyltransferase family 2 protein [Actimicrobium sp. CCI2.3]MDY7576122.1 glycosyltransferase family 2 protein [Actimicrobium sp. CCI2.3]MEB0023476.1 glycosyltransferase family 2 protein [Actimicrobium sp. CCI2.3]